MQKPYGYDDVKVSSYSALPVDAYICRTVKVEERKNKHGKDMIVVALDIADGEYSNYFMNLFNNRKLGSKTPNEVKYPNNGIAYVNVYDQDNKTTKKFKRFCVAVEADDRQIAWNDNFARSVTGARIGVIFRREENEYEGKRYWQTKPFTFIDAARVESGDYTVPDDLPLEAQDNGYGGFNAVTDDVPW